jgi:hypothetical protein
MALIDHVVFPANTSPHGAADYTLALQTFLGSLTPSGLSPENVAEEKERRPELVRGFNSDIALDLQRVGRALFVGQLLAERCVDVDSEPLVAAILAHALLTAPR